MSRRAKEDATRKGGTTRRTGMKLDESVLAGWEESPRYPLRRRPRCWALQPDAAHKS